MRKKRLIIIFLLVIILAQLGFLLYTYEASPSPKEAFSKQTEGLSPIQKLNAAATYFQALKQRPISNLWELDEIVDLEPLLKSIKEEELKTFESRFLKKVTDTSSKEAEDFLDFDQLQIWLLKPPHFSVDFKNLRDPFRPYDPSPLDGVITSKSPLELYDVSEMSLTAVVESEGALKGYLIMPDGKGYLVAKGDVVGKNGGQILDVFPNKIVILESVKDFAGNVKTVQKEIFLKGRR
jgi:hypothetical protein